MLFRSHRLNRRERAARCDPRDECAAFRFDFGARWQDDARGADAGLTGGERGGFQTQRDELVPQRAAGVLAAFYGVDDSAAEQSLLSAV